MGATIRQFRGLCFLLFLGMLAGCATAEERFPIQISYQGEAPSLPRQEVENRVVVFPFEDGRAETHLVGRHLHVFGQIDTFESKEPVGKRVAELLVISLRQRGWDARLADSGLSATGASDEGGKVLTDRVVTGKVQKLWAEAVSHVACTEIDANLAIRVEIQNLKSAEKTFLDIENQNDPRVLIFNPKFIQETLDELVSGGVNRVLP